MRLGAGENGSAHRILASTISRNWRRTVTTPSNNRRMKRSARVPL